jgi:lysozyme family protein
MSSDAFNDALPFILSWEGRFVDHPADSGGRTNRGVTQRVYDRWRERQGLRAQDVKHIQDSEVRAIYESDYWLPPRCDLLGQPLDLVQFDTAANMGPGRAVRFLQKAVGCEVDGDFGPGTERAVRACDPGQAIATYCNIREQFYRHIVANKPSQAVFLKGWMNRLNGLRKEVGLPGYESARALDFGDAAYIARVPDIGEDASYDF